MSNVYLAGHTGYQFTRTKGAPVEPFAPNDCPQSLRNAFLDFFRPRSNSFKSLCLSSAWSTCSRLLALRPSACNHKRGSARSLNDLSREAGREKTTGRGLQSETTEIRSPELCARAA